jgi:midasin
MRNFMKNSLDLLDKQMKMNSSNAKFNQIVFIISDGRFNKSVKLNLKKNVRPYSLEAREKGYLYVFIILDKCGSENQNSILNSLHVYQKLVQGKSEMVVMKYLEDFPYNYYVVLESSSDLPDVVNNILVKWISMLNA